MTDDVTDRARAALEGVTCGPWTVVSGAWGNVWHFPDGDHNDGRPTVVVRMGGMTEADSTFIAASRSLVPELLAEVERLRGALEELRAACGLNATDDLLSQELRDAYGECAESLSALLLRSDQ